PTFLALARFNAATTLGTSYATKLTTKRSAIASSNTPMRTCSVWRTGTMVVSGPVHTNSVVEADATIAAAAADARSMADISETLISGCLSNATRTLSTKCCGHAPRNLLKTVGTSLRVAEPSAEQSASMRSG